MKCISRNINLVQQLQQFSCTTLLQVYKHISVMTTSSMAMHGRKEQNGHDDLKSELKVGVGNDIKVVSIKLDPIIPERVLQCTNSHVFWKGTVTPALCLQITCPATKFWCWCTE